MLSNSDASGIIVALCNCFFFNIMGASKEYLKISVAYGVSDGKNIKYFKRPVQCVKYEETSSKRARVHL